jgi:hypothetical protein
VSFVSCGVSLTSNGPLALEHHVQTERDLLEGLTAAQRAQLADLLRRLLVALGDDIGARAPLK